MTVIEKIKYYVKEGNYNRAYRLLKKKGMNETAFMKLKEAFLKDERPTIESPVLIYVKKLNEYFWLYHTEFPDKYPVLTLEELRKVVLYGNKEEQKGHKRHIETGSV